MEAIAHFISCLRNGNVGEAIALFTKQWVVYGLSKKHQTRLFDSVFEICLENPTIPPQFIKQLIAWDIQGKHCVSKVYENPDIPLSRIVLGIYERYSFPAKEIIDNQYARIEKWLMEGGDINVPLVYKEDTLFPIKLAIMYNHIELVKLFLLYGANIYLHNHINLPCYYTAFIFNRYEICQQLMAPPFSLNLSHCSYCDPPLLARLSQQSSTANLEYAWKQGALLEQEDEEGNTALFYACEQLNITGIQWLISHGANVNKKNKNGIVAIIAALSSTEKNDAIKLEVIRYLLSQDVDLEPLINLKERKMVPLLAHKKLSSESLELIRLLSEYIKRSKNPQVLSEWANTLLYIVEYLPRDPEILKVVEMCFEYGADPNGAVFEELLQDDEIMEAFTLFIQHPKFQIEQACTQGTPLFLACLHGCPKKVKLLYERGADISVVANDKNGMCGSILDAALSSGNIEVFEFIYKLGPFKTKSCNFILDTALASCQLKLAQYIITMNIDNNFFKRSENGTPLLCSHIATGDQATIRFIYSHIKNEWKNKFTKEDYEKIYRYCMSWNKPEMFEFFLKKGFPFDKARLKSIFLRSIIHIGSTQDQSTRNFVEKSIAFVSHVFPRWISKGALHSACNESNIHALQLLLNSEQVCIYKKYSIGPSPAVYPFSLLKKEFREGIHIFQDHFMNWKIRLFEVIKNYQDDDEELKKYLLLLGTVRVRDNMGNNPLHCAIFYGKVECAKQLFALASDLIIQENHKGETPLSKMCGSPELLLFFRACCDL